MSWDSNPGNSRLGWGRRCLKTVPFSLILAPERRALYFSAFSWSYLSAAQETLAEGKNEPGSPSVLQSQEWGSSAPFRRWGIVFVCEGHCKKAPRNRWLQQQERIFSQLWRLDVQDQGGRQGCFLLRGAPGLSPSSWRFAGTLWCSLACRSIAPAFSLCSGLCLNLS